MSEVDEAYSAEQRALILRLLNTASRSQLESVRELRGRRAAGIVRYREECGALRDLSALREVTELRSSTIRSVCEGVLSLSHRTERRTLAPFLRPDITLSQLKAVQSVVSIVYGLKKMAWAHVDNTATVRDWQQRHCFHFMKGKHLPEMYLEDVSSVVSRLPQADLYILEKPSLSTQNTTLFPVVLHLRTVEAMLYCLLNPQIQEDGVHRVFSMTRNTVGKHFDLMVGELRTSGVDVVRRLIDEADASPTPRLNVPPPLVQQYRQEFQARGQNRNEELCDALLQALACYELTLLK